MKKKILILGAMLLMLAMPSSAGYLTDQRGNYLISQAGDYLVTQDYSESDNSGTARQFYYYYY